MQILPAATLQGGSMRSDHDQNLSIAPILTGYEQNHARNRCCFLNHLRVPQPQYPFSLWLIQIVCWLMAGVQ